MSKVIKKTIKKVNSNKKEVRGKKLFIITGATGNLGYEYCNYLYGKNNCDIIGLYRSGELKLPIISYKLDLLNKEDIDRIMSFINFEEYREVILIHPVGSFKFEKDIIENDCDEDGINDSVYASNVITFENVFDSIKEKISENMRLNVMCFGSISDKFNVPYWSSYTHSKNILRNILKKLECINSNYQSTFVNVSTVNTGNENKLRPKPLEKENWLSVQDIVINSINEIHKNYSYLEIDIFRDSPNYSKDFFTCHSTILKRWLKQMEVKN